MVGAVSLNGLLDSQETLRVNWWAMRVRKKISACGALFFVGPLMFFSAAEMWLRAYQWMRAGVPIFEDLGRSRQNLNPNTPDEALGWRATENHHADEVQRTAGGKSYVVRRSQDQHGFRMFGDVRSKKLKALVIGDSFTQARQASDGKTYYAMLKALEIEVFAYGADGYGTLQEYLILDRYLDMIQPELIIWEYCSNDFINNDYLLTAASRYNSNNGMRRPFWIDGRIVPDLPKDLFEQTRDFADRYSRFLYFIMNRLDHLHARVATSSVEIDIGKEADAHAGFQHAVRITDELMEKVRARVGAVPILAISCDTEEPYTRELKKISERHDIIFLDEAAQAVQRALQRGEDVLHADKGHWNEHGHRIVGEVLLGHLQNNSFLFARRPRGAPKITQVQ